MKLLNILFLFIFLLSFGLQAQTITFNGCNNITVTTPPPFVLPTNLTLYRHVRNVECFPGGALHSIRGAEVSKLRYTLERQQPNGQFTQVMVANTSSSFHDFNNLSVGNYRVKILLRSGTSQKSVTYENPCFTSIGRRVSSSTSSLVSEIFEVGAASLNASLIEFSSGNDNVNIPNTVCSDETDLVFVMPNTTFGETEHNIAISQFGPTGPILNWTSTGWKSGTLELTQLLPEVWQLHHPSWQFWSGYTYRVQVMVRKPGCTPYLSQTLTFTVVSTNGNCRTEVETENLEFTLYPNPTSSELNVDGLEVFETAINYIISDISGRKVKTGVFSPGDKTLYVDELNNGLYILTLLHEQGRSSIRFNVVK